MYVVSTLKCPCSVACALRSVTNCCRAIGFVFEPASGQCTPVMWLHQGSGGAVVPAGSADAHLVNIFLRDQLDEAWKYGSEGGNFTCLLEFTSLSSFQNATTACHSSCGFLAFVRTTAEELVAMVQILTNKTSIWLSLDNVKEEWW
ncbi:hypothetical protein PoB_003020000 [Plakobranchus ocellatus]|uniref:C-type lectin domain-containing protein n=1 Tax=Plakobranchus ocellatus TaxID=259542 RepID=A0AAV4A8K8_9GAST|nr:hypothetical protein PoB_003020000 [Plakobranchus ocellatus]